jgi:hypothetical protein
MTTTKVVKGSAEAQYIHCPYDILRTSDVFMPKTLATKESGRKMMVTMVKITTALLRQSSMSAAWAIAFTRGQWLVMECPGS